MTFVQWDGKSKPQTSWGGLGPAAPCTDSALGRVRRRCRQWVRGSMCVGVASTTPDQPASRVVSCGTGTPGCLWWGSWRSRLLEGPGGSAQLLGGPGGLLRPVCAHLWCSGHQAAGGSGAQSWAGWVSEPSYWWDLRCACVRVDFPLMTFSLGSWREGPLLVGSGVTPGSGEHLIQTGVCACNREHSYAQISSLEKTQFFKILF